MNLNAIKDADALTPGFYLAGYGGKNWPGAVVFCSKDGGISYQQQAVLSQGATMGTAAGVLGNWTGPLDVVDTQNSVNVTLGYETGRLAGVTYEQMLLGLNIAIIGSEIVQFKNATLVGANTYTLSGLLRGRRGTEGSIGSHVAGEKFCLYEPGPVRFIGMDVADIGVPYLWKAVTVGQSIADVSPTTFTYDGSNLKPYAGVDAVGFRDGSSNLTINWMRRNRIMAAWRDLVDVPMSENGLYEIDIFSDNTRTTVLRTLTGSISTSGLSVASYSAAQQNTDFGSPQSTVYCNIYQMSDVVGRGYPLKASI